MKPSKQLVIIGQQYCPLSTLRGNFCYIVREFSRLRPTTCLVLTADGVDLENIFSFGASSKIFTLINFYRIFINIFWSHKGNVDVLVHQGGVYPLLLAPFRLLGLRVFQWKAHPVRDLVWWLFQFGLINKVFTVSKSSFPSGLREPIYISHGVAFPVVDTTCGKSGFDGRIDFCVAGRVAPSKRVTECIDFVKSVAEALPSFEVTLHIVGFTNSDGYELDVKKRALSAAESTKNLSVCCLNAVQRFQLFQIYLDCQFALNFSSTALDKFVIEAAGSGVVVLSSNINFLEAFDDVEQLGLYSESYNKLVASVVRLATDDKEFLKIAGKLKDQAHHKFALHNWVWRLNSIMNRG
ncbi:hypothetical protein [Roseobacter sp. HKCCA0882]|uniref:hypothetical protein n=1 Tax=Roseobacter sp. HKCCA0882 TaxID=3120337 RepID=UPI0030EBE6E7